MISGIASTLAAAAVIGICVFIRRWLKRGAPLSVTGEVLVPKAWQMALPTGDTLPGRVRDGERSYLPMYRMLRQRGAADFKSTTVKLLVENRTEQPLTITNIAVRKEQVGAPYSAVWVQYPPAGAGGAVILDFLLDEENPDAWEASYEDSIERLTRLGSRPYFDENSISLSAGESQSLLITGRAEGIRCSWTLKIEVVQSGKRRVVDLVPEGGPLLTSGVPEGGSGGNWNGVGTTAQTQPSSYHRG